MFIVRTNYEHLLFSNIASVFQTTYAGKCFVIEPLPVALPVQQLMTNTKTKKPFIFLNFLYNKGLITSVFSNNLALARKYESFAKVLYLIVNQYTTKTA